MQIGPFVVTRKKTAGNFITQWPQPPSSVGWWPWVRESFAGAWQRSVAAPLEDVLTHPTFWTCVTLIASDIAKNRIKLVQEDANDICTEIANPAYTPVLRRPNHYQNRIQFYLYWILCKLTRGNAYALKERDARGVVTALYLLDPMRVRPLVSPGGDVFYAVQQDALSGLPEASTVIPAREIIHDSMFTLYHPLVGLSPVYACGHAAIQGLQIIRNSTNLFENGSFIGGILVAPGTISPQTKADLQQYWDEHYKGPSNVGKIAVLGDGLKFEKPPTMTAVDAQLIDQLKWDDEKVCATFHVPAYMAGVGAAPLNNNVEALQQQYYSQCLQVHIESLELCLKEGLEIADPLYVEVDLDGLLRMDTATKMDVAIKGVGGAVFTPNEGRKRFNLPPKDGGDSPYLQQQNFSLAALAKRDASPDPFESVRQTLRGQAPASLPPSNEATTGEKPVPAPPVKSADDLLDADAFELALRQKAQAWASTQTRAA